MYYRYMWCVARTPHLSSHLFCILGLRAVNFYGGFYMANTTDIELGNIDSDKAIAVEIKHDDKISEEELAFVQV